MVGLGILSSTVAYALWQPSLALGILMAFALVDAALFLFMPDVQVCYRCGARYRGLDFETEKTFELETAERYRQERMRLESSGRQPR